MTENEQWQSISGKECHKELRRLVRCSYFAAYSARTMAGAAATWINWEDTGFGLLATYVVLNSERNWQVNAIEALLLRELLT